jgi:AAA ATPase domain
MRASRHESPARELPAASPLGRERERFARDLAQRLGRGEHLLLWGPRGIGKTTLLRAVRDHVVAAHCAYSARTGALDDVTRALEQAYAGTVTSGLTRRAARARLWRAADADPGVLLLDHVTVVHSAMKGFLRRLRGGVVGTILAVDVDSPRERERLRAMRVGCATVRMPPVASRSLARQLAGPLAPIGPRQLTAGARRTLIRAARGRPGWIVQCTALACEDRYWRDGCLQASLVAWDTEVLVRGVFAKGSESEDTRGARAPRRRDA